MIFLSVDPTRHWTGVGHDREPSRWGDLSLHVLIAKPSYWSSWWRDTEVNGELADRVGELGRFDDRHCRGEHNASNNHGEPAEIFAADLDKTGVRSQLGRCVDQGRHVRPWFKSVAPYFPDVESTG